MTHRRRAPSKQASVARLRAAWRAMGDAEGSDRYEAAQAYERALAAAIDPSRKDRTLILIGPGMYVTADGKYEVSTHHNGWYVIDPKKPSDPGDSMPTLASARAYLEELE